MKIVILPGVGFQEDDNNSRIVKTLKKEFNLDIEWFNWKHNLKYPNIYLKYNTIRKWTAEVIFDFQYAINHATELEIPEADYYIGHSAGSLIAMVQGKPTITIGSPIILVEEYQNEMLFSGFQKCKKVLNIINPYDILSYPIPFPHVENYYTKFYHWNPLWAHTKYWNNRKVCKRISQQIKTWEMCEDH